MLKKNLKFILFSLCIIGFNTSCFFADYKGGTVCTPSSNQICDDPSDNYDNFKYISIRYYSLENTACTPGTDPIDDFDISSAPKTIEFDETSTKCLQIQYYTPDATLFTYNKNPVQIKIYRTRDGKNTVLDSIILTKSNSLSDVLPSTANVTNKLLGKTKLAVTRLGMPKDANIQTTNNTNTAKKITGTMLLHKIQKGVLVYSKNNSVNKNFDASTSLFITDYTDKDVYSAQLYRKVTDSKGTSTHIYNQVATRTISLKEPEGCDPNKVDECTDPDVDYKPYFYQFSLNIKFSGSTANSLVNKTSLFSLSRKFLKTKSNLLRSNRNIQDTTSALELTADPITYNLTKGNDSYLFDITTVPDSANLFKEYTTPVLYRLYTVRNSEKTHSELQTVTQDSAKDYTYSLAKTVKNKDKYYFQLYRVIDGKYVHYTQHSVMTTSIGGSCDPAIDDTCDPTDDTKLFEPMSFTATSSNSTKSNIKLFNQIKRQLTKNSKGNMKDYVTGDVIAGDKKDLTLSSTDKTVKVEYKPLSTTGNSSAFDNYSNEIIVHFFLTHNGTPKRLTTDNSKGIVVSENIKDKSSIASVIFSDTSQLVAGDKIYAQLYRYNQESNYYAVFTQSGYTNIVTADDPCDPNNYDPDKCNPDNDSSLFKPIFETASANLSQFNLPNIKKTENKTFLSKVNQIYHERKNSNVNQTKNRSSKKSNLKSSSNDINFDISSSTTKDFTIDPATTKQFTIFYEPKDSSGNSAFDSLKTPINVRFYKLTGNSETEFKSDSTIVINNSSIIAADSKASIIFKDLSILKTGDLLFARFFRQDSSGKYHMYKQKAILKLTVKAVSHCDPFTMEYCDPTDDDDLFPDIVMSSSDKQYSIWSSTPFPTATIVQYTGHDNNTNGIYIPYEFPGTIPKTKYYVHAFRKHNEELTFLPDFSVCGWGGITGSYDSYIGDDQPYKQIWTETGPSTADQYSFEHAWSYFNADNSGHTNDTIVTQWYTQKSDGTYAVRNQVNSISMEFIGEPNGIVTFLPITVNIDTSNQAYSIPNGTKAERQKAFIHTIKSIRDGNSRKRGFRSSTFGIDGSPQNITIDAGATRSLSVKYTAISEDGKTSPFTDSSEPITFKYFLVHNFTETELTAGSGISIENIVKSSSDIAYITISDLSKISSGDTLYAQVYRKDSNGELQSYKQTSRINITITNSDDSCNPDNITDNGCNADHNIIDLFPNINKNWSYVQLEGIAKTNGVCSTHINQDVTFTEAGDTLLDNSQDYLPYDKEGVELVSRDFVYIEQKGHCAIFSLSLENNITAFTDPIYARVFYIRNGVQSRIPMDLDNESYINNPYRVLVPDGSKALGIFLAISADDANGTQRYRAQVGDSLLTRLYLKKGSTWLASDMKSVITAKAR